MICHLLCGLGWYPQLELNQRALREAALWLSLSEYSSLPSTSGAGIPAGRMWPPSLTELLKKVWPSSRHYSFPSASSFPPGSCASCQPPGYWVVNSSSLLLQIYMQSHLWLPLYPGPIPHLQMAIKKGKTRGVLPRSFFLKIPAFLLPPDPVLNHLDLQLDDSVA